MKKLLALLLVLCMVFALAGCDSKDYKEATNAYISGDYKTAWQTFEMLGDYKDSADMVLLCKYAQAKEFADSAEFDKAIALYQELGSYKDSADLISECKYAKAVKLLDANDYTAAAALFTELGDYKDSADQATECNYRVALDMMDQGLYSEAAEMFQAIADYKNCAELAIDCLSFQAESFLIGTWADVSFSSAGIVSYFTFEDGKVDAEMTLNGKHALSNNGTYRIDTDAGVVVVTYPTSDNPAKFAFEFIDGEFVLHGVNDPMEKQN